MQDAQLNNTHLHTSADQLSNYIEDRSNASSEPQVDYIYLNADQTAALECASSIISQHHKTHRSNPRFFILKFIYGILTKGDTCRASLQSIGYCLRQTGYSKNLGKEMTRKHAKIMFDAGLFDRVRDPKNDRYTYEPTELGEWLYWLNVKRNKGDVRIVTHNFHGKKNKITAPNLKNYRSPILIYEREDQRETQNVCPVDKKTKIDKEKLNSDDHVERAREVIKICEAQGLPASRHEEALVEFERSREKIENKPSWLLSMARKLKDGEWDTWKARSILRKQRAKPERPKVTGKCYDMYHFLFGLEPEEYQG